MIKCKWTNGGWDGLTDASTWSSSIGDPSRDPPLDEHREPITVGTEPSRDRGPACNLFHFHYHTHLNSTRVYNFKGTSHLTKNKLLVYTIRDDRKSAHSRSIQNVIIIHLCNSFIDHSLLSQSNMSTIHSFLSLLIQLLFLSNSPIVIRQHLRFHFFIWISLLSEFFLYHTAESIRFN